MRKFYTFLTISLISASALISNTAFAANPQISIETNRGEFIVELYQKKRQKLWQISCNTLIQDSTKTLSFTE